jgi:hypothetical protein
MTADSFPFEHAFLARTATRIINEVRGINRMGVRRDVQTAVHDRVGIGVHGTSGLVRNSSWNPQIEAAFRERLRQ